MKLSLAKQAKISHRNVIKFLPEPKNELYIRNHCDFKWKHVILVFIFFHVISMAANSRPPNRTKIRLVTGPYIDKYLDTVAMTIDYFFALKEADWRSFRLAIPSH